MRDKPPSVRTIERADIVYSNPQAEANAEGQPRITVERAADAERRPKKAVFLRLRGFPVCILSVA
jgi:hypothetical protein